MANIPCPTEERFRQLLAGEISPEPAQSLERHLSECPRCARSIEELRIRETRSDSLQVVRAKGTTSEASPSPPLDKANTVALVGELLLDSQQNTGSLFTDRRAVSPDDTDETFDFLGPPQAEDELGRLGQYRVLEVLGRGGMGVVFRAQDVRLGRTVALKAMLADTARKPSAKERFLREARAAATIESDHVVPIYQVDEDRGVPFIAMPLLKGSSLEDHLRGSESSSAKLLDLPQILRIGREIAEGLSAAHAGGLIHRDVKPANIWLDANSDDRVKILDFGLARATTGDQRLTQSGAIMGTPAYMAPEQARGDKVDGRADLFSLGVILYRLTTGRLPFRGVDVLGTLMALALDHPPAPRELNPGLPTDLSDLIMKLLQKDPNRRIGTAPEVVKTIEVLERAPTAQRLTDSEVTGLFQPTGARPTPLRTRRRTWIIAAGIATVAAAPFIYLAVGMVRVETPRGTLVIEADDPETLVTVKQNGLSLHDKVKDRIFALAPGDGVVEVYEKDGVSVLETQRFRLNRDGREVISVKVLPWIVAVNPKPSTKSERKDPVENKALVTSKETLPSPQTKIESSRPADPTPTAKVEPARSPRTIIADPVAHVFRGHRAGVFDIKILPDGKRGVSVAWDGTARLWDLSTGEALHVFRGDEILHALAVSPDGKILAVTGSANKVYLWNLDTYQPLPTLPVMGCVAFAPDGKRLYIGSGSDVVEFRVRDGTRLKTRKVVKGGLERVYALPGDQQLLCCSFEQPEFVLWDFVKGVELRSFAGVPSLVTRLALFQDGRRVVSAHIDNTVHFWSLETGKQLGSAIQAHPGPAVRVTGVHLLHNDEWLLTTGEDKAIRIWSVKTHKMLFEKFAEHFVTSQSDVSPDGRLLLTGAGWRLTDRRREDKDFDLRLWRLPTP